MVFTYTLPNFPIWAIPMAKIIPMVYTDDGYDLTKVTWTCYCRHLWSVNTTEESQDQTVTLIIDLEALATIPGTGEDAQPQSIPVYVDIDLQIFNERIAMEVNTNKQ